MSKLTKRQKAVGDKIASDTLFPVARRDLAAYVSAHAGSPEVEAARSAGARERGAGEQAVSDGERAGALRAWIDEER